MKSQILKQNMRMESWIQAAGTALFSIVSLIFGLKGAGYVGGKEIAVSRGFEEIKSQKTKEFDVAKDGIEPRYEVFPFQIGRSAIGTPLSTGVCARVPRR